MVLSVTIIAAISAGGCGGGDESSAAQLTGAGTGASDVSAASPEAAAATGDDAGQVTQTLPSTASPLPLIAAGGILSLGAAALLRRYRNVR
jgi:LPXTG-motif cell wall-anchored protein